MRLPHRPTLSATLASAACALLLTTAAPAASAATTQVDVTTCTGGWSIVNNVFSCTDGGAPPPPPAGAPTGCSISPTQAAIPPSGGSVSITATCTGTLASSWTWTGNGNPVTQNGNSVTYTANVIPPLTITGTPTNGNASGNALSASIIVSSPGGTGSCSGFSSTKVIVMDWNSPGRMLTASAGGFGSNDAVVVQISTGPNNSPANNLPKLVAAEYISAPSGRVATLSNQPCDFGPGLAAGASVNGATTITMPFSVGPNTTGYYPALQPNATYYLNIKNAPGSTCGITGSCDMYIDLLKPGSGY